MDMEFDPVAAKNPHVTVNKSEAHGHGGYIKI